MSPKSIHLIFALLSCLWVFCGNIDTNNDISKYVFNVEDLLFHDIPGSQIKGISKKIIIENVPSDADAVSISWSRPAIEPTVSQLNSAQWLDVFFQFGESTAIANQLLNPAGEYEIVTFFIDVRKS